MILPQLLEPNFLPFFSDQQRKATLQIATIDIGETFVKATFNLEGDEPLTLMKCHEIVDTLSAGIRVAHAPRVETIAQTISARCHKCTKTNLSCQSSRCWAYLLPLGVVKRECYWLSSVVICCTKSSISPANIFCIRESLFIAESIF